MTTLSQWDCYRPGSTATDEQREASDREAAGWSWVMAHFGHGPAVVTVADDASRVVNLSDRFAAVATPGRVSIVRRASSL